MLNSQRVTPKKIMKVSCGWWLSHPLKRKVNDPIWKMKIQENTDIFATSYTGWWLTYPSEKIWKSVGVTIPNIWKVIKFMFQTTNKWWTLNGLAWLNGSSLWSNSRVPVIEGGNTADSGHFGSVLVIGVVSPSGKHTKNYGKSPLFMGKFTINGDFPWLC